MLKELFICIIIVTGIVGLDMSTQSFTKRSVEKITTDLSSIKEELKSEDEKMLKDKIKQLDENWQKSHNKLAYYIEHDELEKVETAIIVMKSYIETKDYSSAEAELEEGKFILEHIEEKNAFNIENIF